MEGKPNIHTEEDNEQFETAMGGTKINGFDLAMQIYLLLDDYFCGTFAVIERYTTSVTVSWNTCPFSILIKTPFVFFAKVPQKYSSNNR